MEGLLLVDKPEGWTSFDVVNYVRKIVAQSMGKKPRQVKVGHIGTLDPAATGLLVLCIGKSYTSKVPELMLHDKTYIADITFGASSSTGDKDGDITQSESVVDVKKEQLEQALTQFIGTIKQTPPQYSAVKINGKRAYELAREGKTANIKPRSVRIHNLQLKEFNWPHARIVADVGSGTYIRVLAEDIGKELETEGYLRALRRTKIADWDVTYAVQVESLDAEQIYAHLRR